MVKISAVIITFNEEEQLPGCLASLDGLVDEILILDSFSTDRTKEVALKFGARFEQHIFDGHIQQKNRAKDMATHEWVLSLDADEKLSPELKKNLHEQKESLDADGYTFNRLNFYKGRPIKSCGWYPDKKLRLWKKNQGSWGGRNPHDRFELTEGSRIKHVAGDILHNTYPSKEALQKQTLNFARISAKNIMHENKVGIVVKTIFAPIFKFAKSYILKGGIFDGGDGLTISGYQAKESFLKYYYALGHAKTET